MTSPQNGFPDPMSDRCTRVAFSILFQLISLVTTGYVSTIQRRIS